MDTTGITIMVPTLATIAQIGGGIIALLIVRRGVRKIRRKMRQQDAIGAAKVAKAAELRQERLNALLPSPWNEAHHELTRIHDADHSEANPRSRNFLRHWLAEQENLPRLSCEAVHRLACLLTFEYCDKWDDCLAILAPYSDIKSLADETEKLAREKAAEELLNLRDQLPIEWYEFWTELKGYPSCKMLFAKLIGKHEKDGFMVHAATEVLLTSDQAALLSRALGCGNAVDTKFYAADLVKFVRAETEVPLIRKPQGTDVASPRMAKCLWWPMGPPT